MKYERPAIERRDSIKGKLHHNLSGGNPFQGSW